MEKLQPGSASQEKPPPRATQKSQPRNAPTAPESDKDSGFSDVASECLSSVEQTDMEECPPSSHWSSAEKPPRGHPPPLLVLKNLLVDQGSRADPSVRSCCVHPSYQLLPSSPQILLFPPSVPASRPPPVCTKSTNYLPILNSYTKIAPHPSQLSSSHLPRPNANKRGCDPSQQSQAKRLPSGSQRPTAKGKMSAAPETNIQKGVVLSEDVSCCQHGLTTPEKHSGDTTDTGEPVASSINVPCTKDEVLPVQQQNRSRRFQNTLDILRSSGLLSIAMKTKELARLNHATQIQLERLQEHVALYTKAICSNNPQDWQTLQEALVRSHITLKKIDM
ncbi:CLOCK-interacting pacemaker [Hyla sarda]|uniref:CLOCK-interacting pacemaker n=1 Tax=Hyla sarda TaxID=327740 RepID=UPI0024C27F82|nr:CLOCK-interacting pacemaker [Hyla sarda]XP_056409267.1 CLOCK-interacting pacemaker [Hyla sarda]